jgi:hypothetical protein
VGYDTVVLRNRALIMLLNFYSQKKVELFSEFKSVTFMLTFILLGILYTCTLPLGYIYIINNNTAKNLTKLTLIWY